jgi:hypothetical protein
MEEVPATVEGEGGMGELSYQIAHPLRGYLEIRTLRSAPQTQHLATFSYPPLVRL